MSRYVSTESHMTRDMKCIVIAFVQAWRDTPPYTTSEFQILCCIIPQVELTLEKLRVAPWLCGLPPSYHRELCEKQGKEPDNGHLPWPCKR